MTAPAPVVDLDHVAIAVRDIDASLDLLQSRLGATIVSGDVVPGYRFAMTRIGDAAAGMNVELLQPRADADDDFLQRFLDRHGEGPHHITFLQRDIRATLETFGARGYDVVKPRLGFGPWEEGFVHPMHGLGTVIQIAGSTIATPPMADLLEAARRGEHPPEVPYDERGVDRFWWAASHPPRACGPAARLERVVIGVPDLAPAREVLAELLHGTVVESTPTSIELSWGGSGRLRFEHRDASGVERLELSGFDAAFDLGAARFRPAPSEMMVSQTVRGGCHAEGR